MSKSANSDTDLAVFEGVRPVAGEGDDGAAGVGAVAGVRGLLAVDLAQLGA